MDCLPAGKTRTVSEKRDKHFLASAISQIGAKVSSGSVSEMIPHRVSVDFHLINGKIGRVGVPLEAQKHTMKSKENPGIV